MAKSERMRLIGVANRAARTVSFSEASTTPSHPAHALPVLKSSKLLQDSVCEAPGNLPHGVHCHALHNTANNAVSSVSPVPGVNGSSGVFSSKKNSGSSTFINNMSDNANEAVAREFDLFELACADDSTIGTIAPRLGVSVCRLTLKTCNLTTKLGFKHALALVRASAGASTHSSLPCTPWSTWKVPTNVNIFLPIS